MEGFFYLCTITIWVHVPALSQTLPHTVETECKVLTEEKHLIKTGAEDQIYVTCESSIKWLEVEGSKEFWISKNKCK